jgi:outer membrane protein OmpA-like peptidoglycan-associated protein
MRSFSILGAVLALGIASPVLAQEERTVDVGVFGRATVLDKHLSEDMPIGLGGHFGLFLKRNVALEANLSRSAVGGDAGVVMVPFSLRLAYHKGFGDNWTGILGGGMVKSWINPPGAGGMYGDEGLSGVLGVQRRLRNNMSLRVDGVVEHHFSPITTASNTNVEHTHLSLQFGVTWRFNDGSAPAPAPAPMPAPAPAAPADSDNDGVIDANDACASTPAGTRVDARGCAVPVDSDRDGVMDNADRCANTPAGTRVDANGCPVPVDSDGDGVMDNADRCANTPAGTRVDGNGCPVPVDSDGDGVMDNADACANTARGTAVDARGCARIFEEGRATLVLEGVTFNTGSAVLTEGAKVVLDKMAETLNGAPDVNVEVQGHTDNTGSLTVNTRLSGLRAESVRAYLVSKGVNAARLTAKGYGPTVPVADNATPAGRTQNRRVELKRTN